MPMEQHACDLAEMYPTGAVRWACRTCAYEIIFGGPPEYRMVRLNNGDENALHSGGAGGVSIAKVDVSQDQQVEDEPKPWDDWMENNEGLWTTLT